MSYARTAVRGPLVGWLAQYGFGMSLKDVYDASGETKGNIEDAKALSDSLLLMLVYPWTFCLCFYILLHLVYKKDKLKAKSLGGSLS